MKMLALAFLALLAPRCAIAVARQGRRPGGIRDRGAGLPAPALPQPPHAGRQVRAAPVDVKHADFTAAFRTWMDAAPPCPAG